MLYRPKDNSHKDRLHQKLTQSTPYKFAQNGQPSDFSLLLSVPSESLLHITSFLEPPALLALSRTNHRLHDHVEDDNTWLRAFLYQFLDIGPEGDLDRSNGLLLRRSESSWKREFVLRYNLRRRWELSRIGTTSYVPHHSTISGLHIMPEYGLLASSIQYGIVSRSIPLNGKVLRGFLDASGTGLGIGNPNAEFTPNVSACAMSSIGGTARILWGFRSGEVAVMTSRKAMDSSAAAAKLVRCHVRDEHSKAVQDIAWDMDVPSVFVSGALDGQVQLWDTERASCLWKYEGKPGKLVQDPCMRVISAVERGVVVGAMQSGDIVLWSGFTGDVEALTGNIQTTYIASPLKAPPTEDHALQSLHLDARTAELPSVVVSYKHHPYFYKVRIDPATKDVLTTTFGTPSLGSITALEPVFARPGGHADSGFVLAGDQLGCVSIYAWSASPSSTPVVPVRKFEAHDDGAVTALAWTPVALLVGSARGSVSVFDALTLAPLRFFASVASRPAAGMAWEGVSRILVERELMVVAVGSKVMAWRAGPVGKDKPHTHRHGKGKRVKSAGMSKYHQQLELYRDISESRKEIELEQRTTRRVFSREREQRSTLDTLGLDEVEAVEYVLMLSRDEAERQSGASSSATPAAESSGAEVEEGVFEADYDDLSTARSIPSSRRSSSLSIYHSGRSSAYHGVAHASSMTSVSHHRLQVSPAQRAEPMEAETSISPLPSASVSPPGPDTRSPEHFPSMSASTPSTSGSWARLSASGQGSPEIARSAWSTPLQVSPGTSPRRSPPAGAVQAGPSLLAQSKASQRSEPSVEDELDADIKYAIELSLAEAESATTRATNA